MNIFGKRPLALFCASFATASVCGALLSAKHLRIHLFLSIFLFLTAVLLFAIPLFCRKFHPRLLTPILALLFASLSFLQSCLCLDKKLELVSTLDKQEIICRFQVKEQYFADSYLSSYRVEIDRFNAMATVSVPFHAEWNLGDIVEGTFTLHTIQDNSSNASYYLSDGILLELDTEKESFSVVHHVEPDPIAMRIYKLRENFSNTILRLVSGDEGRLISSLFLNKRELLDSKILRDFRRTGSTHLLAISGMHLSVIILFSETFLRLLDIKKKGRCVAILITAFFYLALTGFALSTCRAFLMCCFVYLSWLFRSDNDAFTSLFFSLFIILVISPFSVYDIGMWMSVLAVLGILTASYFLSLLRERLAQRKKKFTRRIFQMFSAVCIALTAEFFILFPMWLAFDELSLVALPCGLILSPLVTLVLILTPFAIFFSSIPLLSYILKELLFGIAHVILKLVSYVSSFPNITVSLHHRFFDIFIPLVSALILILLVIKLKRNWHIPTLMGSSILTIAIFLSALRIPPTTNITVDVLGKKENEIIVFSASEKSVVCDITSGAYSAVYPIHEILTQRYTTEISAYVLTHYHTNHVSSLARLFSSLIVRTLCVPISQNQNEYHIFLSLLSLAQKHNIPIIIYDRDVPLSFGCFSLTISEIGYTDHSVHPIFYISASAFHQSLVYVSESAHESPLLYHDICEKTTKANILICGIHGPATKQAFSYPIHNGYVFLTDESLLGYFSPPKDSKNKIISGASRISVCLQKEYPKKDS